MRMIDERELIKPKVYVIFETGVAEKVAENLRLLVEDLLTRVVQRQRATIRREFINAKTKSSDLGSFLYKLLRESKFLELVGAEAGSVFASDPDTDLLRLKGSTGPKGDITLADVFFAPNARGKKVRDVYDTRNPRFEYSEDGSLAEGQTAEATAAGVWARAYWPIQLQFSTREDLMRVHKPCVGTIRIVNKKVVDTVIAVPFSWLELAALEFSCESMFNIVDAFLEADAASFRKEQAFHGTQAIIDGLAKNIDVVRKVLFDVKPADPILKRRFEVRPLQRIYDSNTVKLSLDTAYACARDLSFQVERANYGFTGDKSSIVDKLLTDVIQRAIEAIPFIWLSYSVDEGYDVTDIFELFPEGTLYPPTVRGGADALFSVFLNVFENSIKYRKRGITIHIKLSFRTTAEYVEVRVQDNGIGVAEGEEERIFLRGYRTEDAINHSPRGSGLGLSWCRAVLSTYGGTIRVKRATEGGLITIIQLSRASKLVGGDKR
jgi:hypothetical protein